MRRVEKNSFNRVTRMILILTMTLVLILILALVYGYAVSEDLMEPISFDNKVSVESSSQPNTNTSVKQNDDNSTPNANVTTTEPTVTAVPEHEVINVMLFGMDNRYKRTIEGGRSDVNILVTIDKTDGCIRMTSFMRDLLVYLPSQNDYNRINAAIVYEDDGPAGAVKVIENEFGIEIDHYVITSFVGMANIIDTIGGIDLELTWNNIWEMNGLIQEMNPLFGNRTNSNMISKPGELHVNGIQAVAYSRIRHVDGGYARDSKQKEVLLAAKDQLKDISLSQMKQLLEDIQDYIEMDMGFLELVEVATSVYQARNGGYETIRIPLDDHYNETRYDGMSVLEYDKEYTKDVIYDFIYYNRKP